MGRLILLLFLAVGLSAQTRVNAGGAEYTDGGGAVWGASNGFSGETAFGDTGLAIDDTSDDTLYATGVKATTSFSYAATVTPGLYRIRLRFAELESSPAGTRRFNVVVNGGTYLSNLDVTQRSGAILTAYDRDFVLPVTGTSISMTFSRVSGDPFVNAVEVEQIAKFSTGDTLPDECDEGQYFWETDDNEFHVCSAADTWTIIGTFTASGADGTLQRSDGSGNLEPATGLLFDDEKLTIPRSTASPTTTGGQIVLQDNTDDGIPYFVDVAGGALRLIATESGNTTLQITNSGAGVMNATIDGALDPTGAGTITATDQADGDQGDWSCSSGNCTLDANVVDSAEIATDAVGADEIDGSASETVTGDWDFGGGTLQVPNSTTLPGTCEVGDVYMDTDATSGLRWYLCESANSWVVQGDTGSSAFLDCSSPTELTIATGAVTVTAGGGCFDVDTEADAASDTLSTLNCTAGDSFTLKAESDARTVILDSTGFQVYGATNQSLDQDGDYALGLCVATNTAVIFGFADEAGAVRASSFIATGSGPIEITEQAAPGAADDSNEHNLYADSGDGRLSSHKNGGSEVVYGLVLTHATDCTSVTNHGTGVSLKTGDVCHEEDSDNWYGYDGSAWDQINGGGSSPLTTKGDLYTYTTADARLAVGTDTFRLVADSAESSGLKWERNCGWAILPLSLPGDDNGTAQVGANAQHTGSPGESRDTGGTINTGVYLFLNAGGTVTFKVEIPHNWSNSCGEIGAQFSGRSGGNNGTQIATFDVSIGSPDENTDNVMTPDAASGGATALSDNTDTDSMVWSGALDDEEVNAGIVAIVQVSRDASDTDVNSVYIHSGALYVPIDLSVNPY